MRPAEIEGMGDFQQQILEANQRVAEQFPDLDDDAAAMLQHIAITGKMTGQTPKSWAYRNYADLILSLSPGPPVRAELELPDWVALGELQQCFYNCWMLAQDHPDEFTYVEGYAMHTLFPISHAWLVTPDGRIVDPTWSNPEVTGTGTEALYFGVKFDQALLVELSHKSGYASVFGGDPTNNHRALQYGFNLDDDHVAISSKEPHSD